MSNKTKAAGTSGRHAPQHRKEPSWTVADLAGMPGGLGAKIVVAGVAGATLALPAMSAFASPSSIPTSPGPGLVSIIRTAGQGTAFRAHPLATPGTKARPAGQDPAQHRMPHERRHSPMRLTAEQSGTKATSGSANGNIQHARPTAAASDPASQAAAGPGLLLEPNGTFMTLAQSATNVHTVPAGSLIITSNGVMMRPLSGTYATIYGLITVSQAPGSGTPSPAGMTPGTVSVNPGGPLQAPPQQSPQGQGQAPAPVTPPSAGGAPAGFGGGTVAPTLTPAPVTTATPVTTVTPDAAHAPVATPTPVATPKPVAISTAAGAPVAVPNAPVAAPKAAPPPVQIVSAMGGATIADNGTVTPSGSVNLAFPGSGIGGSLPLSLPSAAPAQVAQPAFPAADQNAVLTDPIFQGLIQNLSQPPSVNQPGPILNPLQDVASTAPATAAPAAVQLAANTFGANGNPVMSDASPLPAGLVQTVAQDSATQNTVAQNTVGQNTVGQNTVGQSIIPPSQGSLLMVQPSIFGSPTIKPLDPGAAMTLSDGTQIQVTDDNRLQITPPGGPVYEVAPGNTYTLPDGSGNQIVVPTVPPVVLQDPGNGDTILAPGSHISLGSGGTVDVTQDGVLRVTSPDGNQVDYAPGSSFALPGGVTISPMTPPQAMNLDQNPATQLASAGAGSQVAANTFDANGNPVASDASQLPVQLAQNQAAAPSLTADSLTVILPDGTPQTFPLGSSTNPLAPPTFGPGNEILVPLGTQVPLPNGGSTTLDSAGTLTFPNVNLPAIHAVPAMPTSDNSPAGTTTVAMNNVDPQTGVTAPSDAGSTAGRGLAPAPAPTDTAQAPAAAPTDTAQAPAATPAPVPTDVAPAPTDTAPAPAPAPTDVAAPAPAPAPTDTAPAPAPAPTDVAAPAPAPAPADVAPAPTLTSSDPSTVSDPLGAPFIGGGSFGGGSFGGSGS